MIVDGALPGIDKQVALVGVAEKGFASLKLRVRGEGGHSNSPPPHSAIANLGRAVDRVERHPMPSRLDAPTSTMLDRLAPHASFAMRIPLANRWLLGPAIRYGLSLHPASNATIRTTTVTTMFSAGVADNVLATSAEAVVNFRILPGDTVDEVIEHVREVAGDDVDIECYDQCWNPSRVSDSDGEAFAVVEDSIHQVFGEQVAVAPCLVIGATDSRYYDPLAQAGTFRFLPVRLGREDQKRLHGTNERVTTETPGQAVRFYATVIKTAAG